MEKQLTDKLLYAIIEQRDSIEYLASILPRENLLEYERELDKNIIMIKDASEEDIMKLFRKYPPNLPNIEFSLEGIDIKCENLINESINNNIKKYKFDYYIWREKNGLKPLIDTFKENYQYYVFGIKDSDVFNEINITNILNLIKFDISLYNFVSKTLCENLIYLNENYYRCVYLPLNRENILIFPNNYNNIFNNIYILHEISHVILNYFKIRYNLILSIEEEEKFAHLIESSICNDILIKNLKYYRKFITNLLIENIVKTEFQRILYKDFENYKDYNSKKLLLNKLSKQYGLPENYNILDIFIEEIPFYSGAYILGQIGAVSNLNMYSLKECLIYIENIYS